MFHPSIKIGVLFSISLAIGLLASAPDFSHAQETPSTDAPMPTPTAQITPTPTPLPDQAPGELGAIDGKDVAAFQTSPRTDTVALVTRQGDTDRTLSLYRGATGTLLWSQAIPENFTYTLAFSGDGRYVAVAGLSSPPIERREEAATRGVARVFEAKTGKVRNVLTVAPRGFLHSLALAPQTPLLAVAGHSWIEVWNYATGKRLGRMEMEGEVTSLAFSPDGTRLAGVSLRTKPTIWSVKTRKRLAQFPRQDAQSFNVAFSPVGKTIALAGNSFTSLYNSATRKRRWRFEHNYGVMPAYRSPQGYLVFSADGRFVGVSGVYTGILNAQAGKLLQLGKNIQRVQFGPKAQVWGFQEVWDHETRSSALRLMCWPSYHDMPQNKD